MVHTNPKNRLITKYGKLRNALLLYISSLCCPVGGTSCGEFSHCQCINGHSYPFLCVGIRWLLMLLLFQLLFTPVDQMGVRLMHSHGSAGG